MEKNYRIHTNIASDTVLNVNMKQDFDFMEILSLKLRQKDAYRLHSSNYGVIIGRVLANDAFGIPNAKISLFIERDENDSTLIESIYPYSDVISKDREGRRYNILPDYSDEDCYRVVGTFPNKRLVLDDDIQLEIYDKYWKYTTVTNSAGDYMIFGVPSGSQKIHVDIDLSDIGILSQTPTDFTYKGYNIEMFDSPKQFKESTNLDNLAQIISQNKSVFVYPFWGDVDNGVAAITRSDIQVQYKFEPTCVFMGSIVSDNGSNSIGHKCAPSINNGMNNQLVAGEGTIEMIRKTVDGFVEEFQIKGNRLINNDGVWCYQIPMNLDYIGTDEYGNIVPTDNPNKGIATRTQVRFRISKDETGDEGISRHTAKYLVPMNPMFSEDDIIPTIKLQGKEIERMYTFGTSTPQSCFRDLYWNNVYSVKNYIPKTQVAHRPTSKNYGALKGSNLATDQNQVPFNKLFISLPFTFMIICLIFTIIVYIIWFINNFIIRPIDNILIRNINRLADFKLPLGIGRPFKFLHMDPLGCIPIVGNIDAGNTAYYPGCGCPGSYACKNTDCPEDFENDCEKSSDTPKLLDLMQQKLAQDFEIVRLDLHQDWINGCLYMPLWYWRKRKKKSWLFGLIKSRAKNEYCSCDKKYSRLKTYVTCDVKYKSNSLEINDSDIPEKVTLWHKSQKQQVRYLNGLIKPVENNDGLTAYYYVAVQATDKANNQDLSIADRVHPFPAIRLYATDIILLGNLRENNLYGIPQFFNSLPSTTANVPPIATVEESPNTNEDKNDDSKVDTSGSDDSGATITTGMDWGHDGNEQLPTYKTGLFMDLACTYASTKVKACFNVERLSEYGVNLDMTYDMSYANTNGISDSEVGTIETDGFISKLELDDMENRAMFATMNHMGFIPQDYQDSVSGYTTQVLDDNTNYLIPKFKFIYPVDFDGRLQIPMNRYKRNRGSVFKQALFDERDQQYLTFRLGAESGDSNNNSEGRIRHFYIHPKNSTEYHMPLYNNSFYFYFGIKPGSTAIDKFNEMFNAVCFKNAKIPFTPIIETQGKSYCPQEYDVNTSTTVCDYSKNYAYGYIRVTVDDIKTPYTYALYDSNNIEIVRESGMTMTDFVIGGTFIEEDGRKCVKINREDREPRKEGFLKYQIPDREGEYQYVKDVNGDEYGYLKNQIYTLELIDNDGKMVSQKVKLEKLRINANIETEPLGTKFYDDKTTRIDYICNDKNNFYGKIKITNISVDGYVFDITSATVLQYDNTNNLYRFNVQGIRENEEVPIKDIDVYVTLQASIEDSGSVVTKDCLCDKTNRPSQSIAPSWDITSMGDAQYYAVLNEKGTNRVTSVATKELQFNVYRPSSFVVTLTQYCGCLEEACMLVDNTTSVLVQVDNGENFNAFLNTMPVRFMIGTTNDSQDATIANGTLFYSSDAVTNPTLTDKSNMSGWYGLHQESQGATDIYKFPATIEANAQIWEDFVNLDLGIKSLSVKQKILQFKFRTMFALADAAYVTKDSNSTFEYTASGGGSKFLYRSVMPYYDEPSSMASKYVLNDYNTATLPDNSLPHIICNTYYTKSGVSNGPLWNDVFYKNNQNLLGNYFAVFSMNGRYNTKKTIDCNIDPMRLPNFTTQFPYNDSKLKEIGKDIVNTIGYFSRAYNSGGSQTNISCQRMGKTQPYLRTLYIDRRFDFDLTVLGPCMGENFKLHPTSEEDRVWKSSRIYGFTFNGIEMSYDEEQNIISATPQTVSSETEYGDIVYENTGFTTNKRVEYSYSSSGDTDATNTDAKTQYNEASAISVWSHDNLWSYSLVIDDSGNTINKKIGYDSSIDFLDLPITKQPYTSLFGDIDIKHLYWSLFNQNRLNTYCMDDTRPTQQGGYKGLYDLDLPYYVYHYPYNNDLTKKYNWDFNWDKVINDKNYPTIRYVDIGNIYPAYSYDFEHTSCKYETNITINQDQIIEAKAAEGETFNFSLDFSSPIEFVPPTDGNADYANVVFKKQRNARPDGDGFFKFEADEISFNFRYTPKDGDEFDVYTRTPRMIKVLTKNLDSHNGYISENTKASGHYVDGITYYKTGAYYGAGDFDVCAEARGGEVANVLSGITVTNALGEQLFTRTAQFLWLVQKEVVLPSGVELAKENKFKLKNGSTVSGRFFKKDEEWLKSDDTDFTNILFTCDVSVNNPSDPSVFAIIVDREYVYKSDDMLSRRLRTVECSDLFDARHVLLKPTPNNPGIPVEVNDEGVATSYETPASYVMVSSAATEVYPPSAVTSVTPEPGEVPPSEEGGEPTGVVTDVTSSTANTSANTKIHIQVLAFRMKFSTTGLPTTWQCQAFGNYNLMTYTFKFTDNARNIYYVNCNEFYFSKVGEGVYYLDFVVKWTQNMGIMIDNNWSSGALVEIYAKTPSNFTYKLSEFTISLDQQCYQMEGNNCSAYSGSKDKMTVGKKLKTDFSIKNG